MLMSISRASNATERGRERAIIGPLVAPRRRDRRHAQSGAGQRQDPGARAGTRPNEVGPRGDGVQESRPHSPGATINYATAVFRSNGVNNTEVSRDSFRLKSLCIQPLLALLCNSLHEQRSFYEVA